MTIPLLDSLAGAVDVPLIRALRYAVLIPLGVSSRPRVPILTDFGIS